MHPVKHDEFLINEFVQFSIQAGFATRNEDFPIYDFESLKFTLQNAKAMKGEIRSQLISYYKKLCAASVSEKEHKKRIKSLSYVITSRYKAMLHNGRFRIGVSQKILNLFLKYLWSADLTMEPHHCPFDNVIKRKIQKYAGGDGLTDWTELTTMKEYDAYVSSVREAANREQMSIAEWEMKHWKGR
ncbi:MAG: hypothetical protein ABR913_01935 [Sedimentisphaerales bacterium]|jgi:hypothetical protein